MIGLVHDFTDNLETAKGVEPEDVFVYLSRNTTKQVCMETESEKILLDLRDVRANLRQDTMDWTDLLKTDKGQNKIPLLPDSINFRRAWSKHLEATVGKYNSTQNGFLASPYAVRMMSRFVDFGDYYLNGEFGSIKAIRSMIENHSAAVSNVPDLKKMNDRLI